MFNNTNKYKKFLYLKNKNKLKLVERGLNSTRFKNFLKPKLHNFYLKNHINTNNYLNYNKILISNKIPLVGGRLDKYSGLNLLKI